MIHGNSWLQEEQLGLSPAATVRQPGDEDARTARDWFASAKRALLAPFGVGTIDQALLGVVAAKHFFVRQYALAGKVVILDEVHSYDQYTGTLIDKLNATLEDLGCTVIILSATLTGKRRHHIIGRKENHDPESELSYPLITGRTEGQDLSPIPADRPQLTRWKSLSRHVMTRLSKRLRWPRAGAASYGSATPSMSRKRSTGNYS